MFCKLFLGYAPGVGTPNTSVIPYWLCSECVVGLNSTLLDPSNGVFSVFPLDCFAVINPESSRSVTKQLKAGVNMKAIFLLGIMV